MNMPANNVPGPAAAAAARKRQTVAQAVYLAQIEASQGKCECKTCRILRKANTALVDQFLEAGDIAGTGGAAGDPGAADGSVEDLPV